MRPVWNVFQKLSCTEQRREGVAAYIYICGLFTVHCSLFSVHRQEKRQGDVKTDPDQERQNGTQKCTNFVLDVFS